MSKKEILAWIYYNGFIEVIEEGETLRNCAMLALDGVLAGYLYLNLSRIFVLRDDDPIN